MEHRKYLNVTVYRVFDLLNVIFMISFAIIMIYPFYNQFILSLNDGVDAARGGIYLLPRVFTITNYKMLFENTNLTKGFLISVTRVLVGTSTSLLATGLLSYVVTVKNFSGRKFLRVLFIFTMYFSGGLIPFYLLVMNLKLNDTFTVLWLPSLVNVYYMLIISSYMQGLPDSIVESARIDGCNEIRIFFQIIAPICKPVFAAIAIYLCANHWNSWFDSLIYNPSGDLDTLQVYLRRILLEVEALEKIQDVASKNEASEFRNVSSITLRAATTMVVTLPIVFVYPFFQKYFVGGITMGSVKG